MKSALVFWVEEYFYKPRLAQKLLSFLLLPLSWIYCFVAWTRYKNSSEIDHGISVISVGNLSVGGSGKTPLVTALAKHYEGVAIVLRGYGRSSRGLVVVSDGVGVLASVDQSGDEAMIYALKLPNAIVIVSEDRSVGIKEAKNMGAKVVFLDDGYSKHSIKKLDLLIDVDLPHNFCLPSGALRERLWRGKKATVLKEGRDFRRAVSIMDKSDKMSLITAIARPTRLDAYLPSGVVSKNYFADHHAFNRDEVVSMLQRDGNSRALVTFKDFVKMRDFDLDLALLDLAVEVDEWVFEEIDKYIRSRVAKKD